jgi:RNA polymerase sigma-70 factor, ECF subfamily
VISTSTSSFFLERLQDGESDAVWDQFCARYEPVLMAFARRAGLQEEDARDVVQEALMAFLEGFRAGRYERHRGRLRSWLQGIVFHKTQDTLRRLSRREVQMVDPSNATAFLDRIPDRKELEDVFEQEWERGVLTECLQQVRREVDPLTFQAFELYAMADQTADQVARQLGISLNVVYLSKSRVLSRMRELQQEIAPIW